MRQDAIVRLLLDEYNVEADSRDKDGRSPLSYAAECGHDAIVRLLVDKSNVEADSKDNSGRSPLSFAAGHRICNNPLDGRNDRNEIVVQLLIEREDVEQTQETKMVVRHCHMLPHVATMQCTIACG